jgi:hypothetical protein
MSFTPFFVTGANAKIKLNNRTLAFCTNLSYSVQINHQVSKVLGMYEGTSIEPLGYIVTGSFTVIRYVKNIKHFTGNKMSGTVPNDSGNGVGNWSADQVKNPLYAKLRLLTDGRANEALSPATFQNGTYFDIEVYQKVKKSPQSTPFDNKSKDLGVAKIRDCRITRSDFSISKKSVATQTFSFMALYVDEDSFKADFSGIGQQFD